MLPTHASTSRSSSARDTTPKAPSQPLPRHGKQQKLILETSFVVDTVFQSLQATKWAVKECRRHGLTTLFQPVSPVAYEGLVPSTEIDKTPPKFFTHWDPDFKIFMLQLYFKIKPLEANKPQPATAANGTAAPSVPPRPLPPPPQGPSPPLPPMQGRPPGAPLGNPPRAPPQMPASFPRPPPTANGLRPMPPSGTPPVPPPPFVGSGMMANFTPGTRPPMPPSHGFQAQQMQG
ncbi:uncharacterized protein LOC132169308 [Corylus avellana]|uniref:uncharacterized protein LOC132169308 n=1 Tax=Corylus avellana TaxID=13451 RepID=UPI00286B3895|nr:uncharacterized protein LOC132169308 [Corylus avellana]